MFLKPVSEPPQIFYWSHILYVSYWVLLILHAPNFWKWFVAPAALFMVEKGFRLARSLSEVSGSLIGVILLVLLNKTYHSDAKTIVNLKLTYKT